MRQKHFFGIFFASITLAVLAWFQASASHVSQGAVDAAVSGWNYYAPISRKINLNARPDMVSAVVDSSDNVRYSHSDGQTFTADWFGFSATVCSMASQIAEATKDYSHTAEACPSSDGTSVSVPPQITGTLTVTAQSPVGFTYDPQAGLDSYQTILTGPYAGQGLRSHSIDKQWIRFNILNTSNVTLNYIVTVDQSWLSSNLSDVNRIIVQLPADPSLGYSALGIQMTVNPAGLANGEHSANLTITGNFVGSPLKLPVTLTVSAGVATETGAQQAAANQMQMQGIFPNTFYINDRNYFLIQGVNFNQPVLTTSNPAVTFSEVAVTAGGHGVTGVANVGNAGVGALKIVVKDGEAQAELAVGLLKRPAGAPQIEQISFGNFVQSYIQFVITGANLSRVNKIEFAGLGEAKVEIESTSDTEIRGKLYVFGYSTETPESAVPQAIFSPDNGTLIVNRDAWTFSLISANPGDVLAVEAWKDGVYMDRYTICTVPANQKSCSAARIPTKIDLGVWTEQIFINDKPAGSLKVTVAEAPSQAVAASSALPVLPALPTKTSHRFSGLPSGAYRDGPSFLYKDFVIVANYFGADRANIKVHLTDDKGLNYVYTKDNLNAPLFIDGKGNTKKTVLLNIAGNAFPVNDQQAEYHPAVNVEITADKPIYVLPPEQFATEGRGQTVLEATENAWQAFGFTPPRFQEQDGMVIPYAIFWRNLSAFPDGWDTKITLTNRLAQKSETQLSYYPDYYKIHDPDTCQAVDAGDGTAVVKNIALQAGETKLFYLSSILGVSWNSSYQTEGALMFKFPGGDGGNVDVKAEVVPLSNGRRICAEQLQADNFLRERGISSLSRALAFSALAAEEDGMVSGIGQACNDVGCDAARADLTANSLILSDGTVAGDSPSKVSGNTPLSWQIDNPFKGGVDSVMGLLAVLANFIFQLGIPVAVIIIIYSGVTYLTAGTSDRVKRATNGLKWAAIGLAILLIGKGFVALIQSILSIR